ncbi:MAG: IS110 family transposase [Thermoanaerobaculia bacterium]|jgi:transposase
MENGISHVGIDASKGTLAVAVLYAGVAGVVEFSVSNEAGAIKRMVKRVQRGAPGPVVFCYEAGATGYVLQRQIEALGSQCQVVAPSLIPVKPGHRIKTDRRDARKLAELFRAQLLTAVRPPSQEEESGRDLVRCREDVLEDLSRCRHRLVKMLLRRGLIYRDGQAWTLRHRTWLKGLRFEQATDQTVFEDYMLALSQMEQRLKGLDQELEALSETQPYRQWVGVLCCYRGIRTLTAMTILTELHGFERFTSPRQLMAYLGLVPTEYSSGDKVARGRITKAGNAHVRRVLIEAAHHYRHGPSIGTVLRKRRQGQPAWAIAVADKASHRLHLRYRRLLMRGKPYGKIIVAIARELVGFLWATLQQQAASQRKVA